MENLATRQYNPEVNRVVKTELQLAGINVIEGAISNGEVKTTYTGVLGGFTFERVWSYWVVKGGLPLNIAKEIYADSLGRAHVRAAGHCGCVDPVEWAKMPEYRLNILKQKVGFGDIPPVGDNEAFHNWIEKGKQLEVLMKKEQRENLTNEWYIDMYHIDSLAGLRFFADKLKEYDIAEEKIFRYSRLDDGTVCATLEYRMEGGVMKCGSFIYRAKDKLEGTYVAARLNQYADERNSKGASEYLVSLGLNPYEMSFIGAVGSIEYLKEKDEKGLNS